VSKRRSAKKILRFRQPHWHSQFLEQAEQFEHDYNNNNYSNYVEDASVHAGTDIRIGLLWPAFYRKLSGVDGRADVKQRNPRSSHDLVMQAAKAINRPCTSLSVGKQDAGKKYRSARQCTTQTPVRPALNRRHKRF
jgi:hypothetical protein